MTEKFIKISDLKKKLYYIFRAYGVSPQMRKIINEAINKIPYVIKGDLETTLEVADVQEVKHGKWKATKVSERDYDGSYSNYTEYTCSECKRDNGMTQTNHCPSCGARMDGDVE